MTPDRFQQLEQLYHAACSGTAEEREALLSKADPELRQQVESLLRARTGDEFMDRPAAQNAPSLLEDATQTSVSLGMQLGPYRLETKLGQGGMGEVYRATDTRLGRAVAIKTTLAHFNDRFEREARAISSLNHPNICTLYDIGPNYLVMELVEGETLSARLKKGLLPLDIALLYASQILAGLGEAHSKGIIHRDLKPGNIMIGKSGVKVLDFGLARSARDETITASRAVMGTPAYMAPEQREGKPADARTDIYSFGCVLYEMLSGSSIQGPRKRIRQPKLDKIVNRCLEEDPARRWQSVAELQKALAAAVASKPWARVAIAAAIVFAAIGAAYTYLHRPPKLTSKDTIVLGDFENKTGDPVFDQTLRQGLRVQLQESPFLSLISDDAIQQSLRLMNRPADAKLTPEIAREVCERTGSAAALEGSIASLGNQYILWLRARNCRSGDAIAEEQVQANKKEDVLNALSRVAVQIRTRLGESLATIEQHSTPLEAATTSSLEALKAYSASRVAVYTQGSAVAIPHLQRAIAIDPKFAMAHADLGFYSWNMGQTELGADEVRIAYGLLDRVSNRERLHISMLYDREVTGNLQKELATLETWTQQYPRDPQAWGIIAGWVARGTGQYERGIQAAEHAIPLDPQVPFPYEGVALHNMMLDQLDGAADGLKRAADRKIEIPELLVDRFYLAFLKGDQAGMDREVARAPQEHAEDWMAHNQALVLAQRGRMREARPLWERAVALAEQAGKKETAANYQAASAVCEAHFENYAAARERARAALALGRGRDIVYAAAFAMALSGDVAESQKLAAELEKRFPEDTPVQFEYLPILHALASKANRNPQGAIEQLQRSRSYDFAMPGTEFYARFGGGYPAYVRGQAYLAESRAQEAAAEFQKVLSHRGVVLADPIGALTHLQLARAFALSGEKDKARNAYDDFLSLWKAADPDLPILKEAKSERAKLN
jgi:serine/threonine protein kinase